MTGREFLQKAKPLTISIGIRVTKYLLKMIQEEMSSLQTREYSLVEAMDGLSVERSSPYAISYFLFMEGRSRKRQIYCSSLSQPSNRRF